MKDPVLAYVALILNLAKTKVGPEEIFSETGLKEELLGSLQSITANIEEVRQTMMSGKDGLI